MSVLCSTEYTRVSSRMSELEGTSLVTQSSPSLTDGEASRAFGKPACHPGQLPSPALVREKRDHTVGVAEPRLEPSQQAAGDHAAALARGWSPETTGLSLPPHLPATSVPALGPHRPGGFAREGQAEGEVAMWPDGRRVQDPPGPRDHELHPPALLPHPVSAPGSFRTRDRDSQWREDTEAWTPDPVVPQQSCATFIPEPEFHHPENGQ